MIQLFHSAVSRVLSTVFTISIVIIFIFSFLFLLMSGINVFFDFSEKDKIIYQLIKYDFKLMPVNLFFSICITIIIWLALFLLLIVLYKLKWIDKNRFFKLGKMNFNVTVVTLPTIFLITSLNEEQFMIATTVISFIALLTPLMKKVKWK